MSRYQWRTTVGGYVSTDEKNRRSAVRNGKISMECKKCNGRAGYESFSGRKKDRKDDTSKGSNIDIPNETKGTTIKSTKGAEPTHRRT